VLYGAFVAMPFFLRVIYVPWVVVLLAPSSPRRLGSWRGPLPTAVGNKAPFRGLEGVDVESSKRPVFSMRLVARTM
jgi:hypothetical protein